MSNNKLKVFEGFAGIGAVSKAIERLGIPHELVGFSEIDKYAIRSFCAVHKVSEDLNYGDVCLIDETKLPDFDLYTFGSPCQDFSVAGKQKGATWTCKDCGHEYNPLDVHYSKRDCCPNCNSNNVDKTRSSLVVEALRIIRYKNPKYLLMENVKNLVGKQFKPSFDKIIAELQEYGYNTYWDVLNAKDYGIPQNRERVFVISIRKDIDTGLYRFPQKFDNGIRLKDILEKQVDEKYYIAKEKTEKLIAQLKDKNTLMLDMCQAKREGKPREYTDYSPTLSARDYKEPRLINELVQIGELDIKGHDCIKRVYSENGISPTLTDMQGGNRQPKILQESPVPELVGGIGEINFGKQYRQGNRVYSSDKTAMCLMAQPVGNTGGYSYLYNVGYKIRKLTPKECWRLMGFDDADFCKAQNSGMSDTQLYKQAGNSIVVNCLEQMFKELFITSVESLHNIG